MFKINWKNKNVIEKIYTDKFIVEIEKVCIRWKYFNRKKNILKAKTSNYEIKLKYKYIKIRKIWLLSKIKYSSFFYLYHLIFLFTVFKICLYLI